MKDTSQFTPEQIKKYKVITEEKCESDINALYFSKGLIEGRAAAYRHIRADGLLIERFDFRKAQQQSLYTDESRDKGRIGLSCYGRILSISPIVSDSLEIESAKAILKVGDYVVYNDKTAYSPNSRDWKNYGKYDEHYFSIWLIAVDNLLLIDDQHTECDHYKMMEAGIVKRQENSVDDAIEQMKPQETFNDLHLPTDLKTPILSPDGEMLTSFRGLPTPKFGK